MFLALAVLLTQPLAIPQAIAPHAAPSAKSALVAAISDSGSSNSKPSSNPAESSSTDSEHANSSSPEMPEMPFLVPGSSSTELTFAPPATPASAPIPVAKMSPFAIRGSAVRPPKMWYALTAANHAAATFDAWSTRRVISSGAGRELNPLLRPFANSSGLYAAIQVGPGILDLLGKRMARSERPWVRKMWWVPQVVGTAGSLFSGVHNVHIYHQAVAGLPPQ